MATRSALLVSAVDENHEFLGRVFLQQGWVLFKTRTIESALVLLNHNPVSVVITERDVPPGNWKDLLRAIQPLPDAPLLIVTDRLADECLWAEVLNLGGHDVLGQPFQLTELLWVLGTAWQIKENNQTRSPRSETQALFAQVNKGELK
jgi:DNA-binding response OmpR family regulator